MSRDPFTNPAPSGRMLPPQNIEAEQADLGTSFCGSGGAGAITAQTKYGYKCRYGMRSVEEGVTAINEGCVVLGFGFMDKEELGQKLIEAFAKKHGRA